MTEQEMRIAVAESVGLKNVRIYNEFMVRLVGELVYDKSDKEIRLVPNYPQDLNAMHEVESTLDYYAANYYAGSILPEITKGGLVRAQVFATAHQRCEAYLRVKGL